MPKIEEMFAYVMADKDEDDEGVVGFYSPQAGGWVPMVLKAIVRDATGRSNNRMYNRIREEKLKKVEEKLK